MPVANAERRQSFVITAITAQPIAGAVTTYLMQTNWV